MRELEQEIVNGITTGSIYGILAVGLALMYGVLDIAQFAIGALAMVAGYVVWKTGPTLGYAGAVALGVVVVAALGVFIQVAIFQPLRNGPPVNVFVAAFGLVLILQGLALIIYGPNTNFVNNGLTGGTLVFEAHLTYQQLLVVVTTLVSFGLLAAMLRWTSLG